MHSVAASYNETLTAERPLTIVEVLWLETVLMPDLKATQIR
jgi:hypothetical protein